MDGAGAEDRVPPSKQRSVTAVVTSWGTKTFHLSMLMGDLPHVPCTG